MKKTWEKPELVVLAVSETEANNAPGSFWDARFQGNHKKPS